MNQIKEQKWLSIVGDFNFVRVISYNHCDGSLYHPKQKPFKFHYFQPQIAVPQTLNRVSSIHYILEYNWVFRKIDFAWTHKDKIIYLGKMTFLRQDMLSPSKIGHGRAAFLLWLYFEGLFENFYILGAKYGQWLIIGVIHKIYPKKFITKK